MAVRDNLFDLDYFPLVALLADEEDVLHDEWPVHVVELGVFGQLPALVGLHVVGFYF